MVLLHDTSVRPTVCAVLCLLSLKIQWNLVYPTTSVFMNECVRLNKCRINEVPDKTVRLIRCDTVLDFSSDLYTMLIL